MAKNLHAYYHHGNLKAFRADLEGSSANTKSSAAGGGGHGSYGPGAGSASGGRSWTGASHMIMHMSGGGGKADPNERDALGRTVLHLAAASLSPLAYSFFSMLLKNPHISVNLQDQESGYTALHRAMLAGNIRGARDLLLRNDIDPTIKDAEGMTAFDVYNGTVDGTNPSHDVDGTDLYVWGVNRNFALGIGDSSDKAFPDRVNLLTQNQAGDRPDPAQRFHHVGVKDVVMAKLHTGVVTTESRGNLSLCGFGSNGRLGRTVHSQLSLLPMPDLPHAIVSIALAQDHSLALTSGGYILSWGSNRFSQLGYTIDPADRPIPTGFGNKDDSEVQVSPRRIVGPLKKEWVKGVAAGRMSSACWTEDSVWTWGTNAGHLGYDKAANPVQVVPRKVTALTQPVIDVAISDYAMICLLDNENNDVICFHHDVNFKISFSTPRILSEVPFRPPQSTLKPKINKLTSCGVTFGALSSIGDVFTFTLPNPLEDISKDVRERHVTVKPQLIWALRKNFTAVKDVALGSDGTVIICTHSGHVYVRQRVKTGAGGLKFKRIPYLQRIIKVAVNESGAFAAVRVDAAPRPITLSGRTLEEDLLHLQPHFRRFEGQMTKEDFDREAQKHRGEEEEQEEGSNPVAKDIVMGLRMCAMLQRWRSSEEDSLFAWSAPLVGSDVYLVIKDLAIPAHSTILECRVPALARLRAGGKLAKISLDKADSTRIRVEACHPLVGLLLLQYIYSDDIAAIWDSRVMRAISTKYPDLKLPIGQIKADLKTLSTTLELAPLASVLDLSAKSQVTTHTLPTDLQGFFDRTYLDASPATDVRLVLADKTLACSSVILRARCPFFEAMFADSDWTTLRAKGPDGVVTIKMEHLKWRPLKLVFRFLYQGKEDGLFDYLHQETLDEFLDFVFEVLAAATELLLDRLVLVCSRVIIKHCNAYNAAALACEANFYQATTLKHSIFEYITACMETMLESGLLDDMDDETLADLVKAIQEKQGRKLFVSRSRVLEARAMDAHKDWLALQDIPTPRVRQAYKLRTRSPALSPTTHTDLRDGRKGTPSPLASPDLAPLPTTSTIDDIFSMDEDAPSPPTTGGSRKGSRPITPLELSAAGGAGASKSGGPVWRSAAVEAQRVDLRSIMESQASRTASLGTSTPIKSSTPDSLLGTPRATAGGASPTMTPSKSSTTAALAKSPPGNGTPWKPTESRKTSLTGIQASQTGAGPSAPSLLHRPSGSQASPVPQRSGGGKVITPMKLSSSPANVRKASGPAWSSTSTFAPPALPLPAGPSSPNAQAFSLLAIQQAEQDYADRATKKPARSLMEIQEEEKKRQVKESQEKEEKEFMRWWQEEEKRAKKAGGGTSASANSGGGGGSVNGGVEPANGGGGRGGRGGGRGGTRRVPNRGGRGGTRGKGDPIAAHPGTIASAGSTSNSNTPQKAPAQPRAPGSPRLAGPHPGGATSGAKSTNGPSTASLTPTPIPTPKRTISANAPAFVPGSQPQR